MPLFRQPNFRTLRDMLIGLAHLQAHQVLYYFLLLDSLFGTKNKNKLQT